MPSAPATWLTGSVPKRTEAEDFRAGTSLDQIIAGADRSATTVWPSLEIGTENQVGYVGACDPGYSCAYMNTISWKGPTTPLPMEINPRVVFERMFGQARLDSGPRHADAAEPQHSGLGEGRRGARGARPRTARSRRGSTSICSTPARWKLASSARSGRRPPN